MLDRHARPLAELIERGKREGTVRDVHPAETVTALATMVEGACYRLVPGAGEAELDRLAESLTAIVWHALYPDRAGREGASE